MIAILIAILINLHYKITSKELYFIKELFHIINFKKLFYDLNL